MPDEKDLLIDEEKENREAEKNGRFKADADKLEDLGQLKLADEDYNKLIEAVRKINALTGRLLKKNGSFYPTLTKQAYLDLKKAYEETGVLCEKYLKDNRQEKVPDENAPEGNVPEDETTELVQKLEKEIRSDMNALQTFERLKYPVTLKYILNYSVNDIIDLGDNDLGTVGGNLSKRIPFNYVRPDGTEVKGVFTPKNIFDSEKILKDKIEEQGKADPSMKEYFDILYEGFLRLEEDNKNAEIFNGDAPYSFCLQFYYAVHDNEGNERKQKLDVCKLMHKFLQASGWEEFPDKYRDLVQNKAAAVNASLRFAKAMHRLAQTSIGMNINGGKIKSGSRIDGRNSAMSIVADMMGVPDLIAHSQPMTVRYKGKEIDGTFMELGKGRERDNPTQASAFYNSAFFENQNLGSASDMLVLDFICGNADRHAVNILYRFGNENETNWGKHRFLGIQGIDNDCSFGEYVPKDNRQFNNRMASINGIRVMKYSTAKAVLSMDPEVLKFRLRGLGLTDKQIDCACRRLDMVKKAISQDDMKPERQAAIEQLSVREGKGKITCRPDVIRVIPDDKFGLMSLDQLAPGGKVHTNVYTFLYTYGEKMGEHLEKKKTNKQSLEPEKVNKVFGYFIRRGETEKAEQLLAGLEQVTETHWWGSLRSSNEFEQLRNCVKAYAGFLKDHEDQLMTLADYQMRTDYLKNISRFAKVYLDHKGEGQHKDYEVKRINCVRSLQIEIDWIYGNTDENLYLDMLHKSEEELTAEEKVYRLEMNKYDTRNVELLNMRLRAEAEKIALKNHININKPVQEPAKKSEEKTEEKPAQIQNPNLIQ